MSTGTFVGLIVLALGFIFLLCLAVVWLEKRFPGKSHDERQEQSRGRACRLSFGVGLLYYGFVTVLLMAQQKLGQTIEPYLLVFGGIILQASVYHIHCMITSAFMKLSQKPGGMAVFYLVMGTIASLIYRVSAGFGLLEDMGYPTSFEWVFLGLAVMSFFLAFCWLGQVIHQQLCREKE